MEALGLGSLLLLLQHAQADANAAAVAAKGQALKSLRCVLPRHQAVVLHTDTLPINITCSRLIQCTHHSQQIWHCSSGSMSTCPATWSRC